jgi:hypothetical protein
MTDKYIYTDAKGRETWCYGEIRDDSNFSAVCEIEEIVTC